MSRVMAAAFVAAFAWSATASAADKVVLQLHGPEQFEFAGYYAALWQGFYEQAGIEAEIRPGGGQPQLDPVKEATEGRAQFGTGSAHLVVRAAQGQPLVLVAPIFQQSGAALYYRGDSDLSFPASLTKAKIGRTPATDILDIELASAVKAEGIDPAKIKAVPIEPGKAVAALADRTVDAAMGSAWDVPWQARQRNLSLKSFSPGDYRVEFYGDTLFTLQRTERTNPDLVRRFRDASLKGWDYAFQHQDEVIARMVAETKASPPAGDAAGFFRYQADLARSLANYPNVALGHSNPDRWLRIETSMAGAGALVRTADPGDFLYDPEATTRGRNDERAALLLGAALIVSVAVGIVLMRRSRRAAPAISAMSPGPAASPAERATTPPPAFAAAEADLAAVTPSQPNVVDLNQLLSRSERGLRERLPDRIGLRLSPGSGLWRCRTDPAEVRRLIFELVAAAADHIEGDGAIILGTRNIIFDEGSVGDYPGARIGEYVRVTVRDDGPGLSEEALGRVFEPGASARPAVAIADPIMRSLGGYARVESAEGVGTAVHLYFPRETAPARFKFARAAE
ncbi:MAG TPA: ABC transporter substrate-binding protein [Stellaceae bacterium]|nr:ABC transporter substrate-binding protein [Stellaceae bacterium]